MAEKPRTWTIDEYMTSRGETPVLDFLRGLEGKNKTQAIALLQLLKERGNAIREPQSKALGDGLFELRGHQVRIVYMFRPGQRITLLDGIVKKQDELPTEFVKRMRGYKAQVDAADRKAAQGP